MIFPFFKIADEYYTMCIPKYWCRNLVSRLLRLCCTLCSRFITCSPLRWRSLWVWCKMMASCFIHCHIAMHKFEFTKVLNNFQWFYHWIEYIIHECLGQLFTFNSSFFSVRGTSSEHEKTDRNEHNTSLSCFRVSVSTDMFRTCYSNNQPKSKDIWVSV